MVILQINDLSYSIAQKSILSNINLDIKCKEVLCLFGGNGAGKSTLLKCIGGINDIHYENIRICGETREKFKEYYKSLGCFFNEHGLYNFLSLRENYNVFLSLYGLKRNEIEVTINKYIEAFELKVLMNKKPMHLSSGQKQRASLALTFMHNPKLLLFDEPLNNLDANFINIFYEILKDYIHQNDASSIIVNHDIRATPAWINKIALLTYGKIAIMDNSDINLKVAYNSIINNV